MISSIFWMNKIVQINRYFKVSIINKLNTWSLGCISRIFVSSYQFQSWSQGRISKCFNSLVSCCWDSSLSLGMRIHYSRGYTLSSLMGYSCFHYSAFRYSSAWRPNIWNSFFSSNFSVSINISSVNSNCFILRLNHSIINDFLRSRDCMILGTIFKSFNNFSGSVNIIIICRY